MKNLPYGQFDVYLPYEDELIISVFIYDKCDKIRSSRKHTKKDRNRFTNNIRKLSIKH